MSRDDDSKNGEGKFGTYKDLYILGTVGVQIVVSILIGFGMGLALDRWLGTKPWLMILFILFGVGAGFINLFRIARIERFK